MTAPCQLVADEDGADLFDDADDDPLLTDDGACVVVDLVECQLIDDDWLIGLFTDLDDTDPLLDDDCTPTVVPPIDTGGRGGRVRLMEPDDWLIALPARYPWE